MSSINTVEETETDKPSLVSPTESFTSLLLQMIFVRVIVE